MDKNTLSNYGWIVIAVLVLSVMIALATPFGSYIEQGVRATTEGLFDTSKNAVNSAFADLGVQMDDQTFEEGYTGVNDEKTNPLIHNNVIPKGGKYIQASGFGTDDEYFKQTYTYDDNFITEGNPFPELKDGDMYYFGDYVYAYNAQLSHIRAGLALENPWTRNAWGEYTYGGVLYNVDGWAVCYIGTNTTPDEMLESINGMPIVDMQGTFSAEGSRTKITVAPKIPNTAVYLEGTYEYSDITQMPSLPNTTKDMQETFSGCENLTITTNIPDGVTAMNSTFNRCVNLAGTLIMDAHPIYYDVFLYDTKITSIKYSDGNTHINENLYLAEKTYH